MKRILMVAMTLCVALGLGGCKVQSPTNDANKPANETNVVKSDIAYSNLNDDKTRNEVATLLVDSKLAKEDVDKYMNLAKDFVSISKDYKYKDGFNNLPKGGANYDSLILDDSAKPYEYVSWLNCRVSAFTLMKSVIETSKQANDKDTWLMFDIEALKTITQLKLNDDELLDFITLFNQIDVKDAKTQEDHENKIVETLKTRNIKISSDKASLVNIYLHDPEDKVRFVGHTGVLIDGNNGLMFVEKYSNLAPFQVTKFKDKAALKDYLLSRDDLYGDESEMKPIITINGEICK